MKSIGHLTTRFLDLSETFIYEPLRLFKDYQVFAYALQRRNRDKFPYERITTIDELPERKRRWDLFWGDLGYEHYLLEKMKEDNVSLLHAHYGYMGVYALQYKKKLKLPLITSFYGLDVYQHTRNPFYRKQLKKLFKAGDFFLACSDMMRQDLIKLGAPPSRTFVHYGGAILDKFSVSLKKFRPDENVVILMCGRFVEKKGFEYGISAFLHAAKQFDNLQLKIIGSGKEEAKLKALAKNSPFGDQIIFLGDQSHEQYLAELSNCHIFMSPSVVAQSGDREGLPTVLIEAAAFGKPLIATEHSGIPELVHHKKNGLIVFERDILGLENAIKKMLQDSYKWPEYAEYSRKLVEEKFDMRKQVAKLQAYYKELLL